VNENNSNGDGQTVFKEDAADLHQPNSQGTKTSTGLEANIAGLLCYVFGAITGIVFLILEKENKFVRFHAWQSTITFLTLVVLNFVLTAIPIIGWLIGLLITPLGFILWIVLMVMAYQGKWFKLPVIGNFSENQLKNQA